MQLFPVPYVAAEARSPDRLCGGEVAVRFRPGPDCSSSGKGAHIRASPYVCANLKPVVDTEIKVATECPDSGSQREFGVRRRKTAIAALLSSDAAD